MVAVHTSLTMVGGRMRGLSPAVDNDEPLRKGEASEGTPGEGEPGPPGKSAYQSWLDLGNVGTEADFIASLKGEPGAPGSGEGGGTALARTTKTVNAGLGTLATGKSALLLQIAATTAARIRVYATAAARAADASRPTGTLPAQGSGCLLEYITTSTFLGGVLAPAATAYNADGTPASQVYTNVEATGACTVTFTLLKLE